MKPETALREIKNEYVRASKLHPPIVSPHEGYAIIAEELDELWSAVRHIKHAYERSKDMRTEAIQVGAMAMRFLVDLIGE